MIIKLTFTESQNSKVSELVKQLLLQVDNARVVIQNADIPVQAVSFHKEGTPAHEVNLVNK